MSGQNPYWRVAFRGHGQVPQGHRPDLVVHGEMARLFGVPAELLRVSSCTINAPMSFDVCFRVSESFHLRPSRAASRHKAPWRRQEQSHLPA